MIFDLFDPRMAAYFVRTKQIDCAVLQMIFKGDARDQYSREVIRHVAVICVYLQSKKACLEKLAVPRVARHRPALKINGGLVEEPNSGRIL
jgi:hypothetical protein